MFLILNIALFVANHQCTFIWDGTDNANAVQVTAVYVNELCTISVCSPIYLFSVVDAPFPAPRVLIISLSLDQPYASQAR